MKNTELEQLINEKLNSAAISDYAPNGLQVEGKETVQKIVTGVTASQALLDEAVRLGADAVIVHHGYFWKGESPVIRGMKRNRLKTLLANDINLYGRHIQCATVADTRLTKAVTAAILHGGVHARTNNLQHTPSFWGTKRTLSPGRNKMGSSRSGSNRLSEV